MLSRWLTAARGALAEGTRAQLAAQLAISPSECESVLRRFESRVDATFSRLARE